MWQGGCDKDGYGIFSSKIETRAHRFAWVLEHEVIGEGLCVLHRCDTPACCRVSHLFLGTSGDNARDCAAKGRSRGSDNLGEWRRKNPDKINRGEKVASSKLTTEDVIAMRAARDAGESLGQLAERFGIHYQHAYRIVNRLRWAHV